MSGFIQDSSFWGTLLSIAAYMVGTGIKNKMKLTILNPLSIAIIIVMGCLVTLQSDYESYQASSRYITYLLTPATVCLALPLYERLSLLKNNFSIILAGISAGMLTCFSVVFLLSVFFRLTHPMYVTLLSKSVTMAIGVPLVEQLGGYAPIAAAVIIITGILGNMFAENLFSLCNIDDPIARGLALGTASHVIGTAKAMEMGSVEGTISSLAIIVTGLLTVLFINVFAVML